MEAGAGAGLHVLEGGHLPAALGGRKLLRIKLNAPLLTYAQWHRERPTHLVMQQFPVDCLASSQESFKFSVYVQPAQQVIKCCPVWSTLEFHAEQVVIVEQFIRETIAKQTSPISAVFSRSPESPAFGEKLGINPTCYTMCQSTILGKQHLQKMLAAKHTSNARHHTRFVA